MEKGQGERTDTLQTDEVFTRKEYIEREAALKEVDNADVMCDIPPDAYRVLRRYIERIPAADVVLVRHGRWDPLTMSTDNGMEVLWVHAKCGCERYEKSNYCPNCGAKMDKDGDGE